ncbi:LysE family translocator [Synechocystis sp. PCC 7339]|uniref:LysE family translocator n=1 Tax=unclassified Synechocystis TaxID=2640012 RepID=UPI001BAF423F|nr:MULTISPECIES: LysE family translocator [unclassified Synechocystis]QUS61987.1 LysE family transporter [Synechocystis sp. PCC 7338]UAJ74184.1 LysE family translocator [Synechocystis sp. PCC 7339]
MGWSNIFSLFGAMLILAAVPSLSVLTVSSKSASGGFIHGFFATLGVVLGDIIFILIALWGLAFLQGAMGDFFVVLKYIGGIYLIWLGINTIRAKVNNQNLDKVDAKSLSSSFSAGLLITLADQKAVIFYLGFLPTFVDVNNIAYLDTAVIILTAMLSVGGVKLFYAFLAHQSRLLISKKNKQIMNYLAGALMISVGVFLLTSS